MRLNVFNNKPIDACYGCQACAEICPTKAITISANEEGFLFPSIDPNKCIECNLCEKTCPTQDKVISPLFHQETTSVDAAWEKIQTDLLESTSGGAFYAIAKPWIENGGVVYGADFDEALTVRHVRANNIGSLKRLRGSKYVQSDVADTYRQVQGDLKAGVKVIYSGTPCQIAGLRAFLKKDYDNLITIDLVCHGVPSPKMFREHILFQEQRFGKKIVDYKFRGKKQSGWRSYIKYIFADGSSNSFFWGGDFFANCFYRALYNRRSCFTCEFSCSKRVGDITLSDFWGAEKHIKQLRRHRKYGFNMVMCNTEKGKIAYKASSDSLESISVPAQIAIDGDVRLRHTEQKPANRDTIFDEYYKYGYAWLVENRFDKPSLISRVLPTWAKNLIYEIKSRL